MVHCGFLLTSSPSANSIHSMWYQEMTSCNSDPMVVQTASIPSCSSEALHSRIVMPLVNLYQWRWNTGINWQCGKLHTFIKIADKSNLTNYHPINLFTICLQGSTVIIVINSAVNSTHSSITCSQMSSLGFHLVHLAHHPENALQLLARLLIHQFPNLYFVYFVVFCV